MGLCYLMLGSNLGDRAKNLEHARLLIWKSIGIFQKESSIYESEPWGYRDFSSYFNQALSVQTALFPIEVLRACLSIEDELGRNRTKDTYEPRSIDIDVLFYESVIIDSKELMLPHPRITQRKFVLEPLCELNSSMIHPLTGKTISEHLLQCEDTCWVRKI